MNNRLIKLMLFCIFMQLSYAYTAINDAKITAKIDKEIISNKDLSDRIKFVLFSLGLEFNEQNYRKIKQQVLDALITENVQKAIAKDLGVKIKPEEQKQAYENFARENNTTAEDINKNLISKGINPQTLKNRITIQMLWARVIRGMYGNLVRIKDADIEKEKQKIAKDLNSDQFEILELVVLIDDNNPKKSLDNANNLYNEVNKPFANFKMIAEQFGVQNGYVGWKGKEQINSIIYEQIKNKDISYITRPIKIGNTYRIIKLNDLRKFGTDSFGAKTFSLKIIALPDITKLTAEQKTEVDNVINAINLAKTDKEMEEIAKSVGLPVDYVKNKRLAEFPDTIKKSISNLKVGQTITINNIGIVKVLDIKEPEKLKMPSNKEIKYSLEQREFYKYSERLLNKIKSNARIVINDESMNIKIVR